MDGRLNFKTPMSEEGVIMGASLVDQYPINLVHIVGFKIIKN